MQSAINQTISLSGDAEVRAKLAALGQAGERAAAQLTAAGRGASGGLGQLSAAVNSLSGSLNQAGNALTPVLERMSGLGTVGGTVGQVFSALTAGFGGFVTAVAGAAAGLVGLANSAAQATIATENAARTLGLTVEQFEGVRYAAGQVGVASDRVAVILDRFSAKVGQAKEALDKEARVAAAAVPSLEKSQAAHEALTRAVDNASLAADRSATGAIAAGKSTDDQADKLVHLKEAYQNSSNSAATDLRLKKQIEDAEISAAVAQQRATEAVEANRLAVESLAQAEIKRNNALREEMVKQNAPVDVPLDNSKGIMSQLALLQQGGASTLDLLGAFADKFKALKTSQEQAALGMATIGRGWAELAPLLNLGSAGIEKLSEDFKRLNVSPTDAEKGFASQFVASFAKLTTVLDGLKNAVGNIVGQWFTPMFNAIAEGLAGNAQNVRDFAQTFMTTLGDALQPVGAAFKAVFWSIGQIIGLVSDSIKALFGKDISEGSIAAVASVGAIILVIGRLLGVVSLVSGAFTLLGNAIEFAGILMGALDAAAAPWILMAALIGAVVVALGLMFVPLDRIQAAITAVFGPEANKLIDTFAKYVATVLGNLWDGVIDYAKGLWERLIAWVEDKLKSLAQKVASLIGSGASPDMASGDSATAVAFASGGRVPGSGSGDTVPAMLTPGEFVMRVAAVAHYGSDFMRRLNSLQLPKFEVGGLVESLTNVLPVQHFASGGLVAATANVGGARVAIDLTLNGETFAMMAADTVASKLVDHARHLQTQSAGRKPSWFGGV